MKFHAWDDSEQSPRFPRPPGMRLEALYALQVKKFKITWRPLNFSTFPFWCQFWLQTCLPEATRGGDKSLKKNFGKCHRMIPSKVPGTLDPMWCVWKHYTHPESVLVKKYKITWKYLNFSIFPSWSQFWLHITCCCFSSKKFEKCLKKFFSLFLIVFDLLGVPKWY